MNRKFVVAIGNFDGFHLGHKKIINEMFRIGNKKNLTPVLVTFDPNPKVFFKKENKLIFTLSQKKEFLNQMNLRNTVLLNFKKISDISGREFIQNILIKKLKMEHIIVGYNFRFGKNRECDINSLKILSRELKFGVTIIAPILLNGEKISSTLIRDKIREGDVDGAAKLLGHFFYIDGVVSKGSGRGVKLGFPTINIVTENELYPKGVFHTSVIIGKEVYDSISNIGVNPTFVNEKGNNIKIETHIFGFNKSIYGEKVRVLFKKKIRDEKRFELENELIEQIKQDISLITVDK